MLRKLEFLVLCAKNADTRNSVIIFFFLLKTWRQATAGPFFTQLLRVLCEVKARILVTCETKRRVYLVS